MESSNSKVKRLEIENAQLKQTANLTLYKLDSLEQYCRRENLRIHNVLENKETIDNGEEIILKVAKCLNVNLQSTDIQQAHRLGKKKLNSEKPRSISVLFALYKKTNEIFFAKSKLQEQSKFFKCLHFGRFNSFEILASAICKKNATMNLFCITLIMGI